MAEIIDGKKISQEIKDELKEKVAAMHAQGQEVTLAVVLVGQDPASCVYVRNKKRACEYIGIRSLSYELAEDTSEEEVLALIDKLNGDKDVNGILVQLPLPKHMDEDKITRAIDPLKDVDGFHPQNVGALSIGLPGFVSCTPAGIIQLLKRSHIDMEGRTQQYRWKTDGTFDAARKCYGHCDPFQDQRSCFCDQTGRYPDRCDRQEAVYYGRLCQRGSRCH